MNNDLKRKLAGLIVAASFAATGTVALANADDVVPAERERHGDEISALAHETESGPGKGAIISEAASARGTSRSDEAKQRRSDEDVDTDEDTDTQASGRPADAGAMGLETAAAAKTDGKAFGLATAEAAKARSR